MITRHALLLLFTYVVFVGNICCGQNTDGGSTDKNGLVGAIPSEDLIWKTAIACEGQKLYIECPNIYNRIQVQYTFYGREDAITCKHPELPSNKICAEQNVTVKSVVMDLCQGELKCEVSATNDFLAQFGTIICPNVYKYLYIKYRCVPKTSLPDAPGLSPHERGPSITSNYYQTSNYAPVQCCYVVPGVGATQTAGSIGGTIFRNNAGIQSVEERIVSEKPQVQNSPKITEIINSHPSPEALNIAQFPTAEQIQNPATASGHVETPVTKPAKTQTAPNPVKTHLARIILPDISKLHLDTLIKNGAKISSQMIRSNIYGLQKKNIIGKRYLSHSNKPHILATTAKKMSNGAGHIETHVANLGH